MRQFTCRGYDWTDRYPAIARGAAKLARWRGGGVQVGRQAGMRSGESNCHVLLGKRSAFLTARVPQDTIDAIERWAASGEITRSEAIRRLPNLGLEGVPAQRRRLHEALFQSPVRSAAGPGFPVVRRLVPLFQQFGSRATVRWLWMVVPPGKDVHHCFMPSWAQTFASRSFSSCTSASRRATLAFTAASSEMPRDGDSAAKPAAEDD